MHEPAPSTDPRPVVVVTGASSGIGRATVIELRRRTDAHLVLAARREDALQETVALATAAPANARDGATITCVACDLSTQAGIDRLVQVVRDDHGRLDALVNNAGIGSDGAFDTASTVTDADRMLALNLRAPIALCHAFLPMLRHRQGTIVNVSSVAGLIGTPDAEVYSATKWGLTGFSEALRASQARHGVRVVCVQPGPVPTPGWPHERLRRSPIGRRLLASDVDVIARTCERAIRGRGGPAPVRPRTYASIPLLRGVAPWLVRWLLASAARRDVRATLHAPLDRDPGPTT